MRAISSRRAAAVQHVDRVVARARAGRPWPRADARAPRAATCGLNGSPPAPAPARRRAPAARRPPPRWRRRCRNRPRRTPASAPARPPASTTFSASIKRDNSPPEAIARQRPRLLAGIGGDQEAHLVGALPRPSRAPPARSPRRGTAPCPAAAAAVPSPPRDPAAARRRGAPRSATRRLRHRPGAPPPPPAPVRRLRRPRFPAPPAASPACPAAGAVRATVTACLRAAARRANSRSSALLQQPRIGLGLRRQPGQQRLGLGQRFLGALQRRGGRRRRVFRLGLARHDQPLQRARRRRATPRPGRDRGGRARRTPGSVRPTRRRSPRRGVRPAAGAAARPPAGLPRPRTGASRASSSTAWRNHASSRSAASIRSRAAASAASAAAPVAPGHRHRVAQRRRHAEGIQQRTVARRIGQAHLLVLALHLDQQGAGAAQQRHPHRLVVEERAGAAVARPARGAARSRPPPPAPARPAARRPGGPAAGRSTAVTLACSAPVRTSPASARAPSARPRLSSRMDLPAPVSPVSTVRPGPNPRSSRSISTTSRIDSAVSMRDRSGSRGSEDGMPGAARRSRRGRSHRSAPARPAPGRRRAAGCSCPRTSSCRGSCSPARRRFASPRPSGRGSGRSRSAGASASGTWLVVW